jgi:thiol-disulfide isomerase/thioredoxin
MEGYPLIKLKANKKIIGMFIMLLLFLMIATGCGSNSAEPNEQNEPSGGSGLTSFQTKDIYGEVKDQTIFKDYELTMVNVWGTFCGPCLDEMPDLSKIHREYEPKGVNIVGIVVDVQDQNLEVIEDQVELAKEIAEGTGANYTHLIVSQDMIDAVLNQFDAIPSSFFVDSDGNIVSEFYIGSRSKEDWVNLFEANIQNKE